MGLSSRGITVGQAALKAASCKVSLRKMFRVAGRQLNRTVSECHCLSARMAPLLLQYNSFASQSKTAFTGSEILNYMGGVDNDKKQLIHKLVNFRMRQGKKTKVREIFHETLHKLAHTDRDGIQLISDALDNVKPICEVANVRIAGNVYPVPGVVDRDRQQTLAVRWVLDAAKKRRGKNSLKLEECLFAEIMDAYKKKGKAREKRQDLHKTAAINRSYSHFRWW
ncbi:ribosomal protein S7 [Tanacetum coccineum]